jgi:hypothetical protein
LLNFRRFIQLIRAAALAQTLRFSPAIKAANNGVIIG